MRLNEDYFNDKNIDYSEEPETTEEKKYDFRLTARNTDIGILSVKKFLYALRNITWVDNATGVYAAFDGWNFDIWTSKPTPSLLTMIKDIHKVMTNSRFTKFSIGEYPLSEGFVNGFRTALECIKKGEPLNFQITSWAKDFVKNMSIGITGDFNDEQFNEMLDTCQLIDFNVVSDFCFKAIFDGARKLGYVQNFTPPIGSRTKTGYAKLIPNVDLIEQLANNSVQEIKSMIIDVPYGGVKSKEIDDFSSVKPKKKFFSYELRMCAEKVEPDKKAKIFGIVLPLKYYVDDGISRSQCVVAFGAENKIKEAVDNITLNTSESKPYFTLSASH